MWGLIVKGGFIVFYCFLCFSCFSCFPSIYRYLHPVQVINLAGVRASGCIYSFLAFSLPFFLSFLFYGLVCSRDGHDASKLSRYVGIWNVRN